MVTVNPSGENEYVANGRLVDVLMFSIAIDDVVTLDCAICSLNVMDGTTVGDTPVAPVAGLMVTTEGGVVSAAAAVVNDDVYPVRALPTKSVTPLMEN